MYCPSWWCTKPISWLIARMTLRLCGVTSQRTRPSTGARPIILRENIVSTLNQHRSADECYRGLPATEHTVFAVQLSLDGCIRKERLHPCQPASLVEMPSRCPVTVDREIWYTSKSLQQLLCHASQCREWCG